MVNNFLLPVAYLDFHESGRRTRFCGESVNDMALTSFVSKGTELRASVTITNSGKNLFNGFLAQVLPFNDTTSLPPTAPCN